MLEWNSLVLYPAGYFTRRIPVEAAVTLPEGWQFATALEKESSDANRTKFKRTTVETLVDSPLYAGRYASRIDLDPGAAVPVHMDLFADRPDLLSLKPEQIEIHRALVKQAYKLFASHHYAHYDFLYSLSDQVQMIGLEHHQSSEDGTVPTTFTEWDKQPWGRDLLPHEYTHSWNGKFRRPADLWTPNYNVPMRDTLLWVYEGQTQYWGEVLAARSGLWTRQQALDQWADTAAYFDALPRKPLARSAGHHQRRDHQRQRSPSHVAHLAAGLRLLSGRCAHLAGCRHADPRAFARQALARRFRARVLRHRRRQHDRGHLYLRGCGESA